jgi:hypothetical protein
LPLDGLPLLKALVDGPNGHEIVAELHRLLELNPQREPRRAHRYHRNLFARIRVDPSGPREVAIVRDISESGVRLQLTASAHLDVMRARSISIEMRLPGTPFVQCEATLVRVVEHHENGVDLAFTFVAGGRGPGFEALLEQLAAPTASNGR